MKMPTIFHFFSIFIISTAESVQLCYTNRDVVHVRVVHVVVVISLIKAHYNIINTI